MPTTIDNTADVIDSRDIIARIEELQAKRTPWAAGWNMPGYMPDSEPVAFPDWSSAQAYILDELRRAADETETPRPTSGAPVALAAPRRAPTP
jgi:hypothetical protein